MVFKDVIKAQVKIIVFELNDHFFFIIDFVWNNFFGYITYG
jgi:hypothetical protein